MKMCNGTCQQGRNECSCNYDAVDEIYASFLKKIVAIIIVFICFFIYLVVTT